jgi:hypothetical protein
LGEPSNRSTRSALLVAHPGHELFLHHWLEREQPIVFVLSDGSGGSGQDRSAASARVIREAGASIGPVFGLASDKRWYEAILACERDLFDRARRVVAATCRDARVRHLVTDSVELYNPMHDLCNALAVGAVRDIRHAGGEIELLDYALEHPELKTGPARLELSLPHDAVQRKLASVGSYLQLVAEVERRNWPSSAYAWERLYARDADCPWPPEPADEPFYERFGRRRIEEGVYRELITYRAHVRPLAIALSGALPP